jgi:hypothetical protein
MVPWESTNDRDRFILAITEDEVQGGSPSTFKPGTV